MDVHFAFEFGEKVEQVNTGLTGTVVAVIKWQDGCQRYAVQPKHLKDGLPADSLHWCDEQDIVSVSRWEVVHSVEDGGPRPNPPREPLRGEE